ncbi:hypothetical protein CISG_00282 [Coccidioides immitis RMSCC 3703]|uniref:Uncharacterized protein n=1 Tax=Coccidioides immitis RMSCC 3703 TaxID=454286 RepID=A0A0J8QL77_COCIT|nr:hypothetical protein CISG_00282 [Coccidioides immitis RMSCC 3703]
MPSRLAFLDGGAILVIASDAIARERIDKERTSVGFGSWQPMIGLHASADTASAPRCARPTRRQHLRCSRLVWQPWLLLVHAARGVSCIASSSTLLEQQSDDQDRNRTFPSLPRCFDPSSSDWVSSHLAKNQTLRYRGNSGLMRARVRARVRAVPPVLRFWGGWSLGTCLTESSPHLSISAMLVPQMPPQIRPSLESPCGGGLGGC